MIEVPGKGKGKLGGFNPDDYKDIFERAAELLQQKRRAEAVARANESDAEGQTDTPAENGTARALITHQP